MDRTQDIDRAYQNGAFIPGSDAMPAAWDARAAAFRDGARAELGLAYGADARNRFDLFHPDATARGLLVFLHGGYWLAFGRETWSHLAAGAVARGWAVAMPSYTLAPQATIPQITTEIVQAVGAASDRIAGPVVVTGHSAGGHLAARIGNLGLDRVARLVPISPVAELSPLMQTDMQAKLHLTPEICAAESPARHPLRCAAHVWVGAQERPAFLWQARLLSEEWSCPWTPEPGRHHFDVIDGLTDPNAPLTRACLDGL
jgi:acetyl esterase/lipase